MDDGAAVGVVVVIVIVGLIIALAAGSAGRSSSNGSGGATVQSDRASPSGERGPEPDEPVDRGAVRETEPEPQELVATFEETAEAAEERTATLQEVIAYLSRVAQKAADTQERLLEAKYLQEQPSELETPQETKNASQ